MKKLVNGSLVDMSESEAIGFNASRAKNRSDYINHVREKADSLRGGGTTINGLFVSTSAKAMALLTGAKVHPKASRKIVTSGGRAVVSEAEYNAVVQGVHNFIQSIVDHEFDLLELIDKTADADLAGLDLDSGWPA